MFDSTEIPGLERIWKSLPVEDQPELRRTKNPVGMAQNQLDPKMDDFLLKAVHAEH